MSMQYRPTVCGNLKVADSTLLMGSAALVACGDFGAVRADCSFEGGGNGTADSRQRDPW